MAKKQSKEQEVHDIVINMANELRPETFSDMVGQPYATGVGKRLGQGVISGQGYLIVGPKGCGKTTLARIIAKSLNCEKRNQETGDPCGKCDSCVTFEAGAHRSILEINAAAYRGINDMKEKISTMSMSVKGYRVYIIDEAHMLTRDAFSALLKPLEESGEKVLFILTTTNPEKIIDTVLSRLVVIPIRTMSKQDQELLIQRAISYGKEHDVQAWENIGDDDISQAIATSSGSGRQAITNISSIVYHGVHSQVARVDIDALVELFALGDVPGVISYVDAKLGEKTVDPVLLVTMLIEALVDQVGKDPIRIARQITDLSKATETLGVATSASIASATIASCVGEVKKGTGQGDAKPQNQKAAVKHAKKKRAFPSVGRIYKVNADSDIDDVIDALLESPLSQKHISDEMYDVLIDPKQSDIRIDTSGNLRVATLEPNVDLSDAIKSVISNSYVMKLLDPKTGLVEMPF